MLLVPNMDTNLRNICACSLLCLDDPIQKTASGPLSLRIWRSLSPISLIACSQVMRRYLPSTSFIGYFRRCEFSVMPCSRTLAPLAQCAPRLSGESNTGSWRTHTPSVTTASIEQPTEQCVQTVRFTSVLPVFAAALASETRLSGSWAAKAAAPAAIPDPLRNMRRSTVLAASAVTARASGLTASVRPAAFLVSSMVGSSDFGRLVVLQHVRGGAISRGLVDRGRGLLDALRLAAGEERGGDSGPAEPRCEQEVAALRVVCRFHVVPPFANAINPVRTIRSRARGMPRRRRRPCDSSWLRRRAPARRRTCARRGAGARRKCVSDPRGWRSNVPRRRRRRPASCRRAMRNGPRARSRPRGARARGARAPPAGARADGRSPWRRHRSPRRSTPAPCRRRRKALRTPRRRRRHPSRPRRRRDRATCARAPGRHRRGWVWPRRSGRAADRRARRGRVARGARRNRPAPPPPAATDGRARPWRRALPSAFASHLEHRDLVLGRHHVHHAAVGAHLEAP